MTEPKCPICRPGSTCKICLLEATIGHDECCYPTSHMARMNDMAHELDGTYTRQGMTRKRRSGD